MLGWWIWAMLGGVGLLIAVSTFGGVVYAVWAGRAKAKAQAVGDITRLAYGVEVIFGLMGSGKSFYAVRRVVDEILASRRPVYTNLPIKWRVMRAYLRLRGGADMVNLIRRLDEKHWRAFLSRQHAYAKFKERLSKKRPSDLDPSDLAEYAAANGWEVDKAAAHPKLYDRGIVAWFNARNGEPIIEGPEANWIPPTAILVIDEVQHWHPMSNQKADPAREDLLAYLTMIRHHLHWLWVITQDTSRIAIEFRLLARYFWRVWNPAETRLCGPIRFKHVGLRMMAYECMSREQMENYERDKNDTPIEKFYIWPRGTGAKVIYRLYSSHTNIGSARAMMRELRRAREAAGLAEDGTTDEERRVEQVADEPKKRRSLSRRMLRTTRKGVVLCTVAAIGYAVAASNRKAVEDAGEQVAAGEIVPLEWPVWNGAGAAPIIGGERTRVGDRLGPRAVLDYVDPSGRQLVLRVDDAEWWLWRWGERQPERVGTIEDVRSAVGRLRVAAAEGTGSAGEPGPSAVD